MALPSRTVTGNSCKLGGNRSPGRGGSNAQPRRAFGQEGGTQRQPTQLAVGGLDGHVQGIVVQDPLEAGAGAAVVLQQGVGDLVLAAFTFDNIATRGQKETALAALKQVLAADGRVVNVVSSPAMYVHEWASFTTRDFPSNREARSGDRVYIVMVDVPDRRPVEDVLCTDDDYAELYRRARLAAVEVLRPLAQGTEPIRWKSETAVAPWVIYVLAAA
jgi:hypothetical protein